VKRREFITLLGGAAAVLPVAARAQQIDRVRRVGVLWGLAPETAASLSYRMAFTQVLRDLGWTEERNLRIDHRWSVTDPDRLRDYATELVTLSPDVLVGDSSPSTAALLGQTRTIPIVFTRVTDPQSQGFVESLARPGRNATGFTNFEDTMAGKWLELLKEIAPGITRVALIYNPQTAPFTQAFLPTFETAARTNAVKPIAAAVHDTAELDTFIAEQGHEPGGSLIAQTDAFVTIHRDLIIAAAARHRLPAVYSGRQFAEAGGLVSYGNRTLEMYRGAAAYVDRILRGAKPADLPVQLPTNFELVINLKTAKALDLSVPATLLARADEVIE
jgi:putative tryptophan/tyrosine transport system substrate-binding protein